MSDIYLRSKNVIEQLTPAFFFQQENCYQHSTKMRFPPPTKAWSMMVVHQYVCRCDCRYVGRTSQRFRDRITQHIPKSTRNNSIPLRTLPTRDCKTKISQSTTVILRLDFTYYKMMKAPNSTTISNFQF